MLEPPAATLSPVVPLAELEPPLLQLYDAAWHGTAQVQDSAQVTAGERWPKWLTRFSSKLQRAAAKAAQSNFYSPAQLVFSPL
jgi:hypothetical protein